MDGFYIKQGIDKRGKEKNNNPAWPLEPILKRKKMTREICKACFKISRVGFYVTDLVWTFSVPWPFRDKVLCLDCFTRFADENSIDWDNNIEFFPVSFITLNKKE